jgi:hypothetical protein
MEDYEDVVPTQSQMDDYFVTLMANNGSFEYLLSELVTALTGVKRSPRAEQLLKALSIKAQIKCKHNT